MYVFYIDGRFSDNVVVKVCVFGGVAVGRGANQQHADSESFWQRAVRGQSVQTEDRRGLLSGQEGSCNTSWLLWSGECDFDLKYKVQYRNLVSGGPHNQGRVQKPVFFDA